jgi:hypothetical protein
MIYQLIIPVSGLHTDMGEGFIVREKKPYDIIENQGSDIKFENFIIAGVPADMENVKDIEKIIKVFVISKRIKNLPYSRKNSKFP